MKMFIVALLIAISYAQTAPSLAATSNLPTAVLQNMMDFSHLNGLTSKDSFNAESPDDDNYGFKISRDFVILTVFCIALCAIGNAIACYVIHSSYQSQLARQRKHIYTLQKKIKDNMVESKRLSNSLSRSVHRLSGSVNRLSSSAASSSMCVSSTSSQNPPKINAFVKDPRMPQVSRSKSPSLMEKPGYERRGSSSVGAAAPSIASDSFFKASSNSRAASGPSASRDMPTPLNVPTSPFEKSHSAPSGAYMQKQRSMTQVFQRGNATTHVAHGGKVKRKKIKRKRKKSNHHTKHGSHRKKKSTKGPLGIKVTPPISQNASVKYMSAPPNNQFYHGNRTGPMTPRANAMNKFPSAPFTMQSSPFKMQTQHVSQPKAEMKVDNTFKKTKSVPHQSYGNYDRSVKFPRSLTLQSHHKNLNIFE